MISHHLWSVGSFVGMRCHAPNGPNPNSVVKNDELGLFKNIISYVTPVPQTALCSVKIHVSLWAVWDIMVFFSKGSTQTQYQRGITDRQPLDSPGTGIPQNYFRKFWKNVLHVYNHRRGVGGQSMVG